MRASDHLVMLVAPNAPPSLQPQVLLAAGAAVPPLGALFGAGYGLAQRLMRLAQGYLDVALLDVATLNRARVIRVRSDPSLDQQFVLQTLLHVEFESLFGEGMGLDEQLMRLVLFGLPGVIRPDQLNLERFALKHDYVLDEAIELDDQVDHVLRVLPIRLHLIQSLRVVLVRLQTQNTQQALLTVLHHLVQPEQLAGVLAGLLALVGLDLLQRGLLHGRENLSREDLLELIEVLALLLDQLQVILDPRVEHDHFRLHLLAQPGLCQEERML